MSETSSKFDLITTEEIIHELGRRYTDIVVGLRGDALADGKYQDHGCFKGDRMICLGITARMQSRINADLDDEEVEDEF